MILRISQYMHWLKILLIKATIYFNTTDLKVTFKEWAISIVNNINEFLISKHIDN